jgi:BlaI family transcriptional regulator, penicillinase repressor
VPFVDVTDAPFGLLAMLGVRNRGFGQLGLHLGRQTYTFAFVVRGLAGARRVGLDGNPLDMVPKCQYIGICQTIDTLRGGRNMPEKTPLELAKRERQLLETVQRLGEGSVAEIRAHLADPPSYSAVRTMLGLLVEKGWLKHRRDGKRYLYRSAMSRERSQRTALRRLLATFFGGSADDAVAALLDISASEMTEQQWDRLTQLIATARKEQGRD